MGIGAIIVSGVLVLPLAGLAMIMAPLSVAVILGTLVAGTLAVRGAVALTSTGSARSRAAPADPSPGQAPGTTALPRVP